MCNLCNLVLSVVTCFSDSELAAQDGPRLLPQVGVPSRRKPLFSSRLLVSEAGCFLQQAAVHAPCRCGGWARLSGPRELGSTG